MIKINLLPPGTRSSSARSIGVFPWKKIGAPLCTLVVLYSVWILAARQLESGALVRLTAEQENLKPKKAQIQKEEAALRALQNRVDVLQSLKVPSAQWAPRLNLLSDALVGQLWFSALNYEPIAMATPKKEVTPSKEAPPKKGPDLGLGGVPALLLQGSAFVTADEKSSPVSRFLQRLREHPEFKRRFSGLDLKSVEHRKVKEQEISDFVITLYPTTR